MVRLDGSNPADHDYYCSCCGKEFKRAYDGKSTVTRCFICRQYCTSNRTTGEYLHREV